MAHTLLVVEDEETLRQELAYQLGQDGYRVVEAADGADALERFRAESPDLILLDVMLPRLSGTEALRIIRRESDVPVLMLTARSSQALVSGPGSPTVNHASVSSVVPGWSLQRRFSRESTSTISVSTFTPRPESLAGCAAMAEPVAPIA